MGSRERSLTLLMTALLLLGACRPSPVPIDASNASIDDGVRWPYWPKSMRIHPLSRLVRETGSPRVVIEARVEFFDADGHTAKGHGQIRIDLHEGASAPWDPSTTDWSLDLRDAEVNRTHFDDITSTYLFRLEMGADQFPERPQLRAYFLSADGSELQAELEIRTK